MNSNSLTFDKPTRSNLIDSFRLKISEIGFLFRESLVQNDLTKGEIRDALAERLHVDMDRVQALFLNHARQVGFAVCGGAVPRRIEPGDNTKVVEILGALGGAGGGALAGSVALGTVMKTVTTGFLFWKATEVTTLATSIALLGLSPVLLPAVTSVALAGGGWMLAGRLSHRQQQKRWRSVFAEQFQRREQELHAWADEVLALEQH